jgi:hypothetical protein
VFMSTMGGIYQQDGMLLIRSCGRNHECSVDFGESFESGAIREALEESEVPVKLEGLLKLQHTPGMGGNRFRLVT